MGLHASKDYSVIDPVSAIDIARFESLVREGYLRTARHPVLPLRVWNYTRKAEYSGHWTTDTLLARGLVTDQQGVIVARSFRKFFSPAQHQAVLGALPEGPFWVEEKLDG